MAVGAPPEPRPSAPEAAATLAEGAAAWQAASRAWLRRPWRWAALAALAGVWTVHRYLDALPADQASPLAGADMLYAVMVAAALLLLAAGVGRWALARLGLGEADALERTLFGAALGLGAPAYGAFALALAGLLYAPLAAALALALAWVVRAELRAVSRDLSAAFAAARAAVCAGEPLVRAVAAFGALAVGAALLVAALPPFAYDALWYHLAAPRLFIQAHRLLVLPQIAQASFPFTVEFIYTLGLLFGSDTAPALLDLACGALIAAATWQLTARCFGRQAAWLAVAALLTASEFRKLAAIPYADLGLTLFQLLALLATLRWLASRRPGWLAVAGLLAGFAAGSKYTALAAVAPLFLLVLGTGRPWRANLRPLALMLGLTVLVAAPWYAKNLVVFHDPVYPLLAAPYVDPALAAAGGPAPAPAAAHRSPADLLLVPLRALQSGDNQSLTGRGPLDYLQLPIQVYARGDLEMYGFPSYLFLLAPLALIFGRGAARWRLAFVAAAQSVLWAVGPQELRYLVPTFPLYAALGGAGLAGLAARASAPPLRRLGLALPLAALMAIALVEDGYTLAVLRPLPVLAGLESRAAFLGSVDSSYGANAYLASVLKPGERALAIGEDRSYYARVPLILDTNRDMAARVLVVPGGPPATAALLQAAHIRYLVVNDQDLAFQAKLDAAATGREQAAFTRFAARYLTDVYSSNGEHVYRVAAIP